MDQDLKVKSARIGAKIYKKPIVSDTYVAYKSVKVGEALGTTTGEVRMSADNKWLVRIVIPIPDGNPLNPGTTYTDRLYWVVDDGSFTFTKDNAPNNVATSTAADIGSETTISLPAWLKWVGFGLLGIGVLVVLVVTKKSQQNQLKAP
jgi:hypothetical protein